MNDLAHHPICHGLKASVWAIWGVIVFEILFMVSPFALYYYSIYSIPLNWLQRSAHAGWLTLHILPHFTYTRSVLSNTLLLISWPLILVGLVLFFLGFVQIYWAKFTGKAIVDVGLYRYVRHPQYLALAIVGLGTTFFWSRFVVLIAYVSMLYLYYFLARHEERVCTGKFGEAYREYTKTTGMFLPKAWLVRLPRPPLSLPRKRSIRYPVLVLVYALWVTSVVTGGWWLKHHVIGHITTHRGDDATLVALAPMSPATLVQIQQLLSLDPEYQLKRRHLGSSRVIGYVAPSSWSVPELGLSPQGEYRHSGFQELLHPTIHGNALDFDENQLTVLITEPVLIGNAGDTRSDNVLFRMAGYVAKLKVQLDLGQGRVSRLSDKPLESGWKGIPVPVY